MDIFIQTATTEWVESYWKAVDTVARERKYLLFLEGPPIESTHRFVGQILEKGWTQFYAVHEGRVVGWCDIIPNALEGTRHCGHLGMGVLPEHRGKGLGTRLISAALADATNKGISRVELEVFATNINAIALYRKMGFIEEGLKKRARFIDGNYVDNLVMARLEFA